LVALAASSPVSLALPVTSFDMPLTPPLVIAKSPPFDPRDEGTAGERIVVEQPGVVVEVAAPRGGILDNCPD
jgi:hypothetical protein